MEYKLICPNKVCGQQISAGSSAEETPTNCPNCGFAFVAPLAPAPKSTLVSYLFILLALCLLVSAVLSLTYPSRPIEETTSLSPSSQTGQGLWITTSSTITRTPGLSRFYATWLLSGLFLVWIPLAHRRNVGSLVSKSGWVRFRYLFPLALALTVVSVVVPIGQLRKVSHFITAKKQLFKLWVAFHQYQVDHETDPPSVEEPIPKSLEELEPYLSKEELARLRSDPATGGQIEYFGASFPRSLGAGRGVPLAAYPQTPHGLRAVLFSDGRINWIPDSDLKVRPEAIKKVP